MMDLRLEAAVGCKIIEKKKTENNRTKKRTEEKKKQKQKTKTETTEKKTLKKIVSISKSYC